MSANKCTAREEQFIREYRKDRNARAAAYRAGYKGNENAVTVSAHRLLKRPHVKARIDELDAKEQERIDFSREEAVNILAGIARDKQRTGTAISGIVRAIHEAGLILQWFQENKVPSTDIDEVSELRALAKEQAKIFHAITRGDAVPEKRPAK